MKRNEISCTSIHCIASHNAEAKIKLPMLNYSVATSRLALRWTCDSPRTGCARRTTAIYTWREQATEWLWRGISADTDLWTIECND